jgi:hypothetical protein
MTAGLPVNVMHHCVTVPATIPCMSPVIPLVRCRVAVSLIR